MSSLNDPEFKPGIYTNAGGELADTTLVNTTIYPSDPNQKKTVDQKVVPLTVNFDPTIISAISLFLKSR